MSNLDNQNSIQNNPPQPQYQQVSSPKNGMAIASMVLGIISLSILVLTWGYLSIVSLILSIIGLPLGVVARKAQPSGKATAGIVLNIIALAICAFISISCLACISASMFASA